MCRLLLAFLLIANLLLCPLRCGTAALAAIHPADRIESAATSCCAACHPQNAAPASEGTSESPAPVDGDDCGCQDCVCDGALAGGDQQSSDARPLLLCWLDTSTVTVMQTPCWSVPTDHAAHLFPDGRAARIALQSWLL